jgi:hypothetical protein
MLPILIGSRAAKTHNENSDYDFIVNPELKTNILKNTNIVTDIKIDFFDRVYDAELLCYLNINKNTNTKIIKLFNDSLEVIVCPSIYLTMIYLTSVIRIIPYSESQQTNYEIWHKRMKTYNSVRSKINYKDFDKMIMDNDTFIGSQYKQRFDDKIRIYGDAIITLEEDQEAFFKDNVERPFDHDYLHTIVAKLVRNEETLLFLKFQEKHTVGINELLFENGDFNEKITMFQEEILTLMLERKIIPSLDLEKTYNIDQFHDDLRSISSHFATNLCGKGHHFLRKWVLDHYFAIMNIEVFDIILVNKAYELCKVAMENNNITKFYNGLSEESNEMYDKIIKLFNKDKSFISDKIGNKLYLSGPNRGILQLNNGSKKYLEIYFKPGKKVIVFKHIEVDNILIQDVDAYYVEQQHNITKTKIDTVREIKIETVHHKAYYNSISQCTGYGYQGHDAYDEERVISDKTIKPEDDDNDDFYYFDRKRCETKTEIKYYLNSFGSSSELPICENIARKILDL